MKILKYLLPAAALMMALASCSDTKSYAELLTDEGQAANLFLVNQKVIAHVPEDSVFQVGPDAPYYQLDEDGNIFMQVLDAGTKGNKAEYDQLIYFRFTRYSLYQYTYTEGDGNTGGFYGKFTGEGEGNDSNLQNGNYSFRFGNYSANSSSQWGQGIQYALRFLPIDCRVNLVIKSQLGLSSEIAYVIPYFYSNVRYFKSQI